jgi:hypothetical protein
MEDDEADELIDHYYMLLYMQFIRASRQQATASQTGLNGSLVMEGPKHWVIIIIPLLTR